MKRWKCTVCGYVHKGEEPPEKCPVCGADRSKFVLLEEEPQPASESRKKDVAAEEVKTRVEPEKRTAPEPQAPPAVQAGMLQQQMIKHHAHPVSVHIPNGVLPVSVFFLLVSLFLGFDSLGQAAFYNLAIVLLSMPLVLYSGYLEWQLKYGGSRTTFFTIKLACGATVTLTTLILVVWLMLDPEVATSESTHRWLFATIALIMLAAAGLAGFIGGKLVFKD